MKQILKVNKDYDQKILKDMKVDDNLASPTTSPPKESPQHFVPKIIKGQADDDKMNETWFESQTEGMKTWDSAKGKANQPGGWKVSNTNPFKFSINNEYGNGNVIQTQHVGHDAHRGHEIMREITGLTGQMAIMRVTLIR